VRAQRMIMVALLFGLPMFVGGAMTEPQPISISALMSYWAIMAIIFPFGCWPLFLFQIARPTAGKNRVTAVLNAWIIGTTLGVSVIYWLSSLLSYDPSGTRVEFAHRLVPYMPRVGMAVGLYGLCVLVSWGIVAAFIRPQVTTVGAAITACVLFVVIYGCGWLFFGT